MEIWKDVIGWEDYYKISSNGIVIRKPRLKKLNGGQFEQMPEQQLRLKAKVNYQSASLNNGFKTQAIALHRLLAIHFIPNTNPELYTYVNHIDGNIHNNKISNLEWCTQSENIIHGKSNIAYSIKERRTISKTY